LIAMNTLIYTAGGSSGNIGVGFAIPVNKVKKVVEELKAKGKVDHEFATGLSVLTVDENVAKTYKLKVTRGVIITQIQAKTPAQKAGLQVEDIIIGINDFRVNDESSIIGIMQEFRAGDEIFVRLLRNNETLVKKMKLEKLK